MHILLVEDDHRLSASIERLLEQLGHSALLCGDAAEAIRALHEVNLPFDAVITDMQLPIGTGTDVLFEIWACEYDIPSLLHSAEDYFQGDDLRKISQQFPFARFQSKMGNMKTYIAEFLSTVSSV